MNRYSIVVQKNNVKIKSNLSLTDANKAVAVVQQKRDVKLNIVAQSFDQKIEGTDDYISLREKYLLLGTEAKEQYGDILDKPKEEESVGFFGRFFGNKK